MGGVGCTVGLGCGIGLGCGLGLGYGLTLGVGLGAGLIGRCGYTVTIFTGTLTTTSSTASISM